MLPVYGHCAEHGRSIRSSSEVASGSLGRLPPQQDHTVIYIYCNMLIKGIVRILYREREEVRMITVRWQWWFEGWAVPMALEDIVASTGRRGAQSPR
jgi:hypothetical protein